jgi:hypothetical protein
VCHGLQGVYVVHLQPLQHHPLHTGLGHLSEPLDDRDQRTELYTACILRQPRERRPQLQAIPVDTRLLVGEVVGAEEASVTEVLDSQRQPSPAVPSYTLLPLDHDRDFQP